MNIFDAVAARHSYRGAFLPDPVPRPDLRRIVQTALAAPSGNNRQTPRFIALDDPALIQSVAGLLKKPNFASAPAAVCVLQKDGERFAVQDCAAAIENMLLAITALGYASCWVEGVITENPALRAEMGSRLRTPQGYQLTAYLPIGKPALPVTPRPREPFEARVRFNLEGPDL